MIKSLFSSLIALSVIATASAAEVGKPAPDFSVKNLDGKEITLADLKDKVVVLEWVNYECPFIQKHYNSGNMGKLQQTYTDRGVIWLSINSAAKGKQGYHDAPEMKTTAEKAGNHASHFLMDTDGKMGKAYDAKVTPHMFIIDKKGVVRYNGAMDSKPTPDLTDVETADKWFVNALEAVLNGKEVSNATNKPYGCGVKY